MPGPVASYGSGSGGGKEDFHERYKKMKLTAFNEKERKELNIFVDEMAFMREHQKAGDIEWFIPTIKFTGVSVAMVIRVSKQVGDHISMKTASLLFMEKLTGGKRHG